MLWASPDCATFSQANNINVTKGAAHGPMAFHPSNLAAAAPERIEEEKAQLQMATRSGHTPATNIRTNVQRELTQSNLTMTQSTT